MSSIRHSATAERSGSLKKLPHAEGALTGLLYKLATYIGKTCVPHLKHGRNRFQAAKESFTAAALVFATLEQPYSIAAVTMPAAADSRGSKQDNFADKREGSVNMRNIRANKRKGSEDKCNF